MKAVLIVAGVGLATLIWAGISDYREIDKL